MMGSASIRAATRPGTSIGLGTVDAAVGLAVAVGVGSSLLMPRGPTTSTTAIAAIVIGLLVGWAGALFRPTRWILVPVLVGLLAGIELGRLDVVGPTLDVRLDTPYGIIAFVLTRGVHWALLVPSVALGVLLGMVTARRLGRTSAAAARRRPVGTAVLGVLVAGLAVLLVWPASTPPVRGPDGAVVPGSLAELTTVRAGGTDLHLMIRAANPDAPVILYLAGGPGQSDLALTRGLVSGLEQDFVWVGLDQRGNGKSYPAIDPVSGMTVDRAVADVIEVTDYLRSRFDERKVYLMGESWGTVLGVLAVQRRPDLFHAWIGSGQMVDVGETDRRIYDDLVAYAEGAGDAALLDDLRRVGEPPYRDIPWANSNLLVWYEYLYAPYTPSATYLARGEAAGLDPFGVLGSEYDVIEKTNVLRGLIDTFTLIFPQLYDIDLRRSAARLEVPVVMLDGAAELRGRRDLALEWFDELQAPMKERFTFEGAAHSVAFEQADEVQRLLREVVVPATYR